MNAHRFLPGIFVTGTLLLIQTAAATAAEKTAADLLPPSTAIYLEVTNPKRLLTVAMQHPLRRRLEEIDVYRQAFKSKQYLQFQAVLAVIEAKIGMKWQPALEKLTAGGIYLGVDPKTDDAVLLVKADDAAVLSKIRDELFKLVRDDANRKGNDDPIESGDYRGITAYKVGDARLATLEKWLVLTNKGDLGKEVLDRFLDADKPSLSGVERFQQARSTIVEAPTVWGFIDVGALREGGAGKELLKDKSDNPVAEMLLGGILATLGKTPYAIASLYVEKQRLRLVAAVPHEANWTGKTRGYYFGQAGKGRAPAPLTPSQALLSIGTHRDISGMWLAKDDLFTENVAAQMTQADSNLSTFFSGRNFGREILGAFSPQVQLVAARQDFAKLKTPTPEIKLPGFALIFQLRDPDKIQRQLKISFQSIVGFANIGSAQNGLPQLELNSEKRGAGRVVSATYAADENKKGTLNYNFSPTIGFLGKRFILSSTDALATELLELATKQAVAKTDPVDDKSANTEVQLNVNVLHDVLTDNRGHLIAQNMLEKGHYKQQAENEIGTLLSLAKTVQNAALRLVAGEKDLRLELDVAFAKGD